MPSTSPTPGDEQLYNELADWWLLLSPPEDHDEQAAAYLELLHFALGRSPDSLLELGSGTGGLASQLPSTLEVTLVDRSEAMLRCSRRINVRHNHVQADMRTLDLGRQFDAVLLHDAVMYLLTDQDLRDTLQAAAQHLRPGGALLMVPDFCTDTFEEGTTVGGGGLPWGWPADAATGSDGRAARLMEWWFDPDPDDGTARSDMVFLLREASGQVRCVHDVHTFALRDRSAYWAAVRAAGLVPLEAPPIASESGQIFLARRPG